MATRRPSRRRLDARNDGIALVVVLWFLLILSIIAAGFVATTQTDTRIARNYVENARVRAMADAAVHLAIYNLITPSPAGFPIDGTIRSFDIAGGRASVAVQSERGKVDLNTARPELLRGLFLSVGVAPDATDALVAAIEDWRDADDDPRLGGAESEDYRSAGVHAGVKNYPFETVEELQQVRGVTLDIYRRVAPALTVYSRSSRVDLAVAPPEALRATARLTEEDIERVLSERAEDEEESADDGVQAARQRRGVFMIRALAQTPRGATFVREAVVLLTANREVPFLFYAWREGRRAYFEPAAPPPSEPQR